MLHTHVLGGIWEKSWGAIIDFTLHVNMTSAKKNIKKGIIAYLKDIRNSIYNA